MFFKKKSKGISGEFNIEFDSDRRSYYRVESTRDRPVSFEVRGRRLPVVDVSAGGMSVHTGKVAVGRQIPGLLHLPGLDEPIVLTLEVLGVDPKGVGRGRFINLTDREQERLHYYVLQRQKEEIEQRRKMESHRTPLEVKDE